MIWNLILNFDVDTTEKQYYEFGDILSEVGGIGASAKIMLAGLGVLWVGKYIYDLALLLAR